MLGRGAMGGGKKRKGEESHWLGIEVAMEEEEEEGGKDVREIKNWKMSRVKDKGE